MTATMKAREAGDDMTRRPDVDELRRLFLFEDLAEERLAWLADRAEVRTFVEGASVYREGEPADALWVLIEGRIRLSRMAAGEDVAIIDTDVQGAEPMHFN